MKTIGLIGGMSWESTVGYYRAINQGVKAKLGGLHSAKIVMQSVDFGPIEKMMQKGDWNEIALELSQAAKRIEVAGAEFLLICTNTMHTVYPQIEAAINVPLLHIADATAEVLVEQKIKRVGLLGTAFTMEQDFYKGRLTKKCGLDVVVPNQKDREIVHDIIFNELCLGKIETVSKAEYLRIIKLLAEQGAEAVILGCTEIAMLVNQADTGVKLLDTTAIHAAKAVEYATEEQRKREMLNVELDREAGLAILRPEGALTKEGLDAVAGVIDPYIEEHGKLNGLIIYTQEFPGWDSFSVLLRHFKFVKKHHQKLSHVAVVTDSKMGDLAEKITVHFISAEVKHFAYGQLEDAKSWIVDTEK